MVGSLSQGIMKAMKTLFLSFVTHDSETMIQSSSELGFIGKGDILQAMIQIIAA